VRKRTDLPFNWIVVLFAIFIVSCGATHWIEVWTVWNPDYWLSANVKLVTAVSSLLTAAALVGLIPRILAIPSTAQLEATRDALEAEVGNRRHAEVTLREERAALERRVLERTEQLALATAQAQAAHAAADEANALKDRFLAKVSHELRTPLQSTLTWVQVLKASLHDPAQAAQASDRIVHNVRSQARLIDDLLDLSRILSGKLRLELQETDGAKVIEKAAEWCARPRWRAASRSRCTATAGRWSCAATGPARAGGVEPDQQRRAGIGRRGPGAGRVRGRRRRAADRGEGRRPWHRRRRPAAHLRAVPAGAGLAELASRPRPRPGDHAQHRPSLRRRAHGEERRPGRGATFVASLPMATLDADVGGAAVQEIGAEDRRRLRGLSVVYVEDEEDIAEGGRRLLESLGVRVELFLDFDRAAARVRRGGFDVLLCDLSLDHGHDGFELLALMRTPPRRRTCRPSCSRRTAAPRTARRRDARDSVATSSSPPRPPRSRAPCSTRRPRLARATARRWRPRTFPGAGIVNENELRLAIGRVRRGTLPRRRFVERLAGLGIAAPLAWLMLADAGVAQPSSALLYKPTRRGGGGNLRVLLWQAPTLLNPHFATGTKDELGAQVFYDALARWDEEGVLEPILAAEIPSRENGGVAADGRSVVWKLKRGVTWHDGAPFTADDFVFNWQFATDPGTAATTLGAFSDMKVERVDSHTGAPRLRPADAVLAAQLLHDGADPEASFRRVPGREVARGAGEPEAGRHRAVPLRRLPARRPAPRRDQPDVPHAEPAALRHPRGEGRRRRGLGGARGAPDRRVRLRLEPAGRGRAAQAHGERRQGTRHRLAGRRARVRRAGVARPVERGRGRARQREVASSGVARRRGARGDERAARSPGRAGLRLRPRRRRHGHR
jgi:CheY-like chemotaxis protein